MGVPIGMRDRAHPYGGGGLDDGCEPPLEIGCPWIRRPRSFQIDRSRATRKGRASGLKSRLGEHEGAQQMLRGVQSHVPVATLPIDRAIDGVPGLQWPTTRNTFRHSMDDRRARFRHVANVEEGSLRAEEGALVGRLPSARRVEERPIQNDSPWR